MNGVERGVVSGHLSDMIAEWLVRETNLSNYPCLEFAGYFKCVCVWNACQKDQMKEGSKRTVGFSKWTCSSAGLPGNPSRIDRAAAHEGGA